MLLSIATFQGGQFSRWFSSTAYLFLFRLPSCCYAFPSRSLPDWNQSILAWHPFPPLPSSYLFQQSIIIEAPLTVPAVFERWDIVEWAGSFRPGELCYISFSIRFPDAATFPLWLAQRQAEECDRGVHSMLWRWRHETKTCFRHLLTQMCVGEGVSLGKVSIRRFVSFILGGETKDNFFWFSSLACEHKSQECQRLVFRK